MILLDLCSVRFTEERDLNWGGVDTSIQLSLRRNIFTENDKFSDP